MQKQSYKMRLRLTLMSTLITAQLSYAQWLQTIPNGSDYIVHTDNSRFITGVGVGDFSSVNLSAALHVNTNFLVPQVHPVSAFPLGEAFLTNCPDISTYWRMQRADVEYGVLFNLNGGDDYPTGSAAGSHFYLQASGGDMRFNTGGAFNRMRILGSNGFVGIGEYTTFYPTNILHINIPSLDDEPPHDVYEQFTNSSTLSGPQDPTDGFRIGLTWNQNTTVADGELIQRQDAQIKFYTNIDNFVGSSSYFNTSPAERIRIGSETRVIPGTSPYNGTFYLTRVAITEGSPNLGGSTDWNGANQTPLALLHLGQAWAYNTGGHRPWMDVGTFYHAGSDIMYTGLKEESHTTYPGLWTQHMDAIVGWGDNADLPDGADNLRFVFTAKPEAAAGEAGNLNGLEVARFSPLGRMGIGNFTVPAFGNGSGIQPHRRLEIYDESVLNSGNGSHPPAAPQLRLTFASDANVNNGIWTDFQTTNQGDLYINPYGWTTYASSTVQTPTNRYVGVNTPTPGNTVEINSGITTPDVSPARQIAGLRFTNLTSASSPTISPIIPNPFIATYGSPCMLSVDGNGDVILVRGGEGNITACTPAGSNGITSANTNFITKITAANEICNSAIYEDNNRNVGIGVTAIGAKLEISNAAVSNPIGLKLTNTTASASTGISSAVTGGNGYYVDGINQTVTGISACIARGLYADVSSGGSSYINALDLNLNSTGASSILKGMFVSIPSLSSCTSYGAFTSLGGAFATAFTPTYTGYKATVSATSGSTTESAIGVDVTVRNGKGIRGINSYVYNASLLSYAGYFASFITGTGSSPSSSFGIYSEASGGNINWGVQSIATGGAESYGIWAEATGGSSHNYAVLGATTPILTGTNGAITGTSTPADAAGFFVGDVFTSGNYFDPSDAMLKQNVTDLTNATAIINQLHPKVYNYDTLQFGYMALAKGQQFGLVAQELESVLPQFVKPLVQPAVKDSSGNIIYSELDFKGVTYVPLITLLLAGFKEQQQQINDLQTQIINCCGAPRPLAPSQGSNEKTGAIDVKLSNGENSAILYQNEPNPYHSATTIRYFIPENVRDVKITFQDATGKTLKEVPVSETGQGSINVDGSDLISGTYTYSLVVSGKVIDTKKMVKVK